MKSKSKEVNFKLLKKIPAARIENQDSLKFYQAMTIFYIPFILQFSKLHTYFPFKRNKLDRIRRTKAKFYRET